MLACNSSDAPSLLFPCFFLLSNHKISCIYGIEDAGSAANGNEEDIDESESLDDESAVNSSLRQILQKLVNEGKFMISFS